MRLELPELSPFTARLTPLRCPEVPAEDVCKSKVSVIDSAKAAFSPFTVTEPSKKASGWRNRLGRILRERVSPGLHTFWQRIPSQEVK